MIHVVLGSRWVTGLAMLLWVMVLLSLLIDKGNVNSCAGAVVTHLFTAALVLMFA